MKVLENNNVQICGAIISDFNFSHESHGEKLYSITVGVERLSGCFDFVPLLISERLVDVNEDYRGRMILANGQFRSFNRHDGGKNRLILFVFVREVEILVEKKDGIQKNMIFLDGYICKEPTYRKTPLGREISDVLLAVNQPYEKSNYIPCIAWGRNARYVRHLPVGTKIGIKGRIQSREYIKCLEDGTKKAMIAYEVSANEIDVAESEGNEDERKN